MQQDEKRQTRKPDDSAQSARSNSETNEPLAIKKESVPDNNNSSEAKIPSSSSEKIEKSGDNIQH